MEKILLVINAHKPDSASIDSACRFAGFAKTKLTGLFIDNPYVDYASVHFDGSYFDKVAEKSSTNYVLTDVDQAIRYFKNECQLRGITPEGFVDTGDPI